MILNCTSFEIESQINELKSAGPYFSTSYDISWASDLTNQKPAIYRNLHENTGPVRYRLILICM